MSPSWPTATQSDVEGQETLLSGPAATRAALQVDASPVGSVEVTTFPAESTAAQNEAEGHDTAVRPLSKVWSVRSKAAGADQLNGGGANAG